MSKAHDVLADPSWQAALWGHSYSGVVWVALNQTTGKLEGPRNFFAASTYPQQILGQLRLEAKAVLLGNLQVEH